MTGHFSNVIKWRWCQNRADEGVSATRQFANKYADCTYSKTGICSRGHPSIYYTIPLVLL